MHDRYSMQTHNPQYEAYLATETKGNKSEEHFLTSETKRGSYAVTSKPQYVDQLLSTHLPCNIYTTYV